jgi:AmmeMemoRadiSam system protein B
MKIRKMKLPDGWYPKEKDKIKQDISDYLNGFEAPEDIKPFRGCIIPHAGWCFSGELAARTLSLAQSKDIDTVVLFGGHLGKEKPKVYIDEGFDTPLGIIETDIPFIESISYMCEKENEFSVDNTVEVELPFIKYFFPDAKIAVFRSPPTEDAMSLAEECVRTAAELKRNVFYIGSLDLTHYGQRYGFSPKGKGEVSYNWVVNENDKNIVNHMLKLEARETIKHAVKNFSSCSSGAGASVIKACILTLKEPASFLSGYYTSRDIMPDDNFVGYAGIGFYDSAS